MDLKNSNQVHSTSSLRVRDRVRNAIVSVKNLEEPPLTGYLGRVVHGLQWVVSVVILLNFAFMIYTVDAEIRDPSEKATGTVIVSWLFQIFYTAEIVFKLLVHRQWFFLNRHWKMNAFDLFLVVIGFFTLEGGTTTAHSFRVIRFVRLAKSLRLLKLMGNFSQLRTLLICIQGSLVSLFWSLAMLLFVYILFSIVFLSIITQHIADTGTDIQETDFYDLFGSVRTSIITLYKATTGGDDWSKAYDVVKSAGYLGGVLFLIFIAFVQFALVNIITGIFVDSAMAILKPDPETVAAEDFRQERHRTVEIDRLCREFNADGSGLLSQEDFDAALQMGHLLLMLKGMGLKRHHVIQLFEVLAEGNGGRVNIDTFVNGCLLLRGDATNFDVANMSIEIEELHRDISRILELLCKQL